MLQGFLAPPPKKLFHLRDTRATVTRARNSTRLIKTLSCECTPAPAPQATIIGALVRRRAGNTLPAHNVYVFFKNATRYSPGVIKKRF
jgi:hypothetical protein